MQINDDLQITGTMTHSLSGLPYQGELSLTWWGLLQGSNWFGSSTIEVIDGQINTTIAMPGTGGLMDFDVAFMDPLETRTIGGFEVPTFIVDPNQPLILDPSMEILSRYHLDDVGIGVNIIEDVSWTLQEPENTLPKDANPDVFREYEYVMGGAGGSLSPFNQFQLKIVMKSSNNCRVPKIRDLRAIALVD